MKVLEILKEQYNMLSKDTDGVWIDPEKIDEAIKELEELETKDRLAELEKVILDYLTKEGFKIDDISCKFEIYLETQYKLKQMQVYFKRGVGFHSSNIFQTKAETTKEMFDAAFKYFSTKESK